MSEVTNKSNVTGRTSIFSDFFENDDFFNWPGMRKDMFPAINISENAESYIVELAAPGFEKDDFKVKVDHGTLKVYAQSRKESEEKKEFYSRREFSSRSFNRAFNIPSNASEDAVEARYENGVLKITLRKKSTEINERFKQIEVK